MKALRNCRDAVAVAHPYDKLLGETREKDVARDSFHFCLAIFARFTRRDLAAEHLAHQLHTVADTENRNAEIKDFGVDAGRAFLKDTIGSARENNARRQILTQLRRRRIKADNFRINLLFANTPRN